MDFSFSFSGSVIGCHILRRDTLFHYYPGRDIPQNQTTLCIFLGRDLNAYTLIPTNHRHPHLFSPDFHCNGRCFLFVFLLVRFPSIRFGGRFQWNGRWAQVIPLLIYAEYFNVSALLILSYARYLHCYAGCQVTEIFHDLRVATACELWRYLLKNVRMAVGAKHQSRQSHWTQNFCYHLQLSRSCARYSIRCI
jgi:hypothetical protein